MVIVQAYKIIQGWYWEYYPEGDGRLDLIMSLGYNPKVDDAGPTLLEQLTSGIFG